MFDNLKKQWIGLELKWKVLIVVVAIMAVLAIFVRPAEAQTYGEADCQIVEGSTDAQVCEFTVENSPLCHDRSMFARPQDVADHYGAVIVGYGPTADGQEWLLILLIMDPDTGLKRSMVFGHPDVMGPDDQLCLRGIGRQLAGDRS